MKNKKTEQRDINLESGNYNENIAGDCIQKVYNSVQSYLHLGPEEVAKIVVTGLKKVGGQLFPQQPNNNPQIIETRDIIFTMQLILEKLNSNQSPENLGDIISFLELQNLQKFYAANVHLQGKKLEQTERLVHQKHELIGERNEIEREKLRESQYTREQNWQIALIQSEIEEERNRLIQSQLKLKQQYYQKLCDSIIQWRTEQTKLQREQNQAQWDIRNWQSILSPEATKTFFQKNQNKPEVAVLLSPPRISRNSPFVLEDVTAEIKYHLSSFLQSTYNDDNYCPANCYYVFRSPLEDIEAIKLSNDLLPQCSILIHSTITDKDFYLTITFAGEQCHIPPLNWESLKNKLEKDGSNPKNAIYLIREFIVFIYKIYSGFFIDLYYLNFNDFHEPKLSSLRTENSQELFYECIEYYLNYLIKIHNKISADKFNEFGLQCFSNCDYEKALVAFNKAITLQPNFFDAWNNTGKTQCKLGMYEQAIKSHIKSIELKSDFYEAWQNKGFAESKLMLYEQSAQSYKKAIELYPDFAEALFNYANVLLQLITVDLSDSSSSLNNIAILDEAIKSHKKAYLIKPELLPQDIKQEFIQQLYKISISNYRYKNYHIALRIYKELAINEVDLSDLLSRQDLVNFWRRYGDVLLKYKDYQSSIGSYMRAIKIQPRNHKLWLLKGVANFQNGDILASLFSLTKALIIKPFFYQRKAKKIIINLKVNLNTKIQQVLIKLI